MTNDKEREGRQKEEREGGDKMGLLNENRPKTLCVQE